jgi:bacteriorhodopsin
MIESVPVLSVGQYSFVFNMLSFAVAAMLGSFAFFVMGQKLVGQKYRAALIVSSVVVLIAGYHYYRIMGSWENAYTLVDGQYVGSGKPFNDAYRYVDWLLTVPLLLVELVLVMSLAKGKQGAMMIKLVVAAVLMIGLGYPGEISNDQVTRTVWGLLSTVPFIYILYVLWVELGAVIKNQTPRVQELVKGIRLLLLASWGFYPIVYGMVGSGFTGAQAEVAIQVGYSIADVTAKALYGVMIFVIAYAKSEADGSLPPPPFKSLSCDFCSESQNITVAYTPASSRWNPG